MMPLNTTGRLAAADRKIRLLGLERGAMGGGGKRSSKKTRCRHFRPKCVTNYRRWCRIRIRGAALVTTIRLARHEPANIAMHAPSRCVVPLELQQSCRSSANRKRPVVPLVLHISNGLLAVRRRCAAT